MPSQQNQTKYKEKSKTKSYQIKILPIAQYRYKPIHRLGKCSYQKTKNTQLWHDSNVGTSNTNSDKQPQNHVGRSKRSDLQQVFKKTDDK